MESGAYSATASPAQEAASIATTADVAELERRLNVGGEEHVFDGDFLGPVALDDGLQPLEDLVEAVGDGGASGGVDRSDCNAMQVFRKGRARRRRSRCVQTRNRYREPALLEV